MSNSDNNSVVYDSVKENSAPVDKKTTRKSKNKSIYCENMSFLSKEAFKKLRTNLLLRYIDSDKKCITIGITSAQSNEGKSTVAINLAYSFAELGKKVMMIDCDMRRPSTFDKLNLEQTPGLSDLLSLNIQPVNYIQKYVSQDESVSFSVITSGSIPNNPAELLDSTKMKSLLTVLTTKYDVLILDFPPIDAVIDAVSAGRFADGMLLVLREGACPAKLLERSVEQLRFAKINIFGFVMNGSKEGAGKKYSYYY